MQCEILFAPLELSFLTVPILPNFHFPPVTETVEGDIRKDQHTREIKYKETGRNQIKENTNFDMARSLFGGGGGEEEYEEEEEEEEPQD